MTDGKSASGKTNAILTPGEKFGDYQILKHLYCDLLGCLYLVRKAISVEEFTMLVLPEAVSLDPEFKNRFIEKVKKLAQLEHPNILGLHHYDFIKERNCLFYHPFAGEHLAGYLESQGTTLDNTTDSESNPPLQGLPQDEVNLIVTQLLQTLTYARSKGIFHHNLNLNNLLRDPVGNIRIVGFGVMDIIGNDLFRKVSSFAAPIIAKESHKVQASTSDILSPEARMGNNLDQRADIYAVGVNTYWLLTGHKPSSKFRPASEFVDGLIPGWEVIINYCMEHTISKRYQTAEHVLNDLKNLNKLTDKSKSKESKKRARALQSKSSRILKFGVPIIGCLLLAIGLFYLVEPNLLSTAESDAPKIIKAPQGEPAQLTLNLKPAHASVKFASGNQSFNAEDGTIMLNLDPGDYQLSVTAPGYNHKTELINVTQAPQALTIQLSEDWGQLTLQTLPGVAATALDQQGNAIALGEADQNGLVEVSQKLVKGTYTVEVHKKDYQTQAVVVDLNDEPVVLTINPKIQPAALRIRSTPEGARVMMEGRYLGDTNLTLENLPTDQKISITLELEGYRSVTRELTLKPGTREPFDFGELQPQRGSIVPLITTGGKPIPPALAEALTIQLKDLKLPGTAQKIPDISVGTHLLTLLHPNYESLTQKITVEDGIDKEVFLELRPKPATIVIQLPADTPKAFYSINNQSGAALTDNRVTISANAETRLAVMVEDYFIVSNQFNLSPNQSIEWHPDWKRIPAPVAPQNYKIPYVDIELVWIRPGRFLMGSPSTEQASLPADGPITDVVLTDGYWIGRFEITQQQYAEIMQTNPSAFKGKNNPTDSVTWSNAVEFCTRLQSIEFRKGRIPAGYEYRLPTEAEWEYAARAGTITPFSWGSTADQSQGNFKGVYPRQFQSTVISKDDRFGTLSVGSFEPNAFGLYDVHGNVREWCLDYYNARLPGGDKTNWMQTMENPKRSYRGGSWKDLAHACRSGARGMGAKASTVSNSIGLRIVLARKRQ